MASKERAELIEEVKELILDGNLYSRTLQETSERILSTILAALGDATGEMCKAGRNETIGVGHIYASDIWRAMLNASPLGEQSE
ncbi:hypothetical protein [Brucella sp.]|uniref:hypothetical protein n=1 Tax=Brucella sp. TaxID=52132 RepID=UPI0028B0D8BC|nr:hypothetical protein [Brucella sp.]